jgi:hypothetical protein
MTFEVRIAVWWLASQVQQNWYLNKRLTVNRVCYSCGSSGNGGSGMGAVFFVSLIDLAALKPNVPTGSQPASGIDEGINIIVFVPDC